VQRGELDIAVNRQLDCAGVRDMYRLHGRPAP
jgi:hypothetical protein